MTTIRKRPRGRPRRQGVMIVNMRIPIPVYDAYCVRAAKAGPEVSVRTVMQRTLTAHVRGEDLDPQRARAMALSLLLAADAIERAQPNDPENPANFRSAKPSR